VIIKAFVGEGKQKGRKLAGLIFVYCLF